MAYIGEYLKSSLQVVGRVPNGTKVESLEQNNRLSPSILYAGLACTHARAQEYILSKLSSQFNPYSENVCVNVQRNLSLYLIPPPPKNHIHSPRTLNILARS